jgi:hypothetical protein
VIEGLPLPPIFFWRARLPRETRCRAPVHLRSGFFRISADINVRHFTKAEAYRIVILPSVRRRRLVRYFAA